MDELFGGASWDLVQWDEALEGRDPHAVGVAVKPLKDTPPGSVDATAFEQLLKRKSKQPQQQQRGGGGGGGFGRG